MNKKGFTLVEIMIVVVIIGLLAAMAIPAFQKVRERSQAKTVLNNCRQLSNAADQYFLEHGVISVSSDLLVGPSNYVKDFATAANEVYQNALTTEGFCTAGPLPNTAYITYPEK